MKDVFYEESCCTNKLDIAKRRYVIMQILSIILIILGIGYCFIFFNFVNIKSPFAIIFSLLFEAGTLGLGIFYKIRKEKFILDFDYTFVSGSIRISKIINGKRRKKVAVFSTIDIIKMGKYGSESFEKLKKDTANKIVYATPNETPADGKEFYYIQISGENRTVIVVESSELFMVNVLRASNKTVLESDFK